MRTTNTSQTYPEMSILVLTWDNLNQAQGVKLKTEDDGRMFPVTDSSQTVVDALLAAVNGVGIETKTKVVDVKWDDKQGSSICTTMI